MSDEDPQFTRDELVEQLQLSPDYAEKVWNAFGFARQSTPDKIFTAAEVKALGLFADSEHTMPQAAQVATARAIGQTMSRLAEWQADQLTELERNPDVPWTREQMANALGVIQQLIWRRHLDMAMTRDETRESDERMDLVVGFADIVGYTSLSRRTPLDELELLLETFEDRTFDVVGAHRGHVIKTLGDGVMFTFATSEQAAEAALASTTSATTNPFHRCGSAWHADRCSPDSATSSANRSTWPPACAARPVREPPSSARPSPTNWRTTRNSICARSPRSRCEDTDGCGQRCWSPTSITTLTLTRRTRQVRRPRRSAPRSP